MAGIFGKDQVGLITVEKNGRQVEWKSVERNEVGKVSFGMMVY